jgi:hypothetical protein
MEKLAAGLRLMRKPPVGGWPLAEFPLMLVSIVRLNSTLAKIIPPLPPAVFMSVVNSGVGGLVMEREAHWAQLIAPPLPVVALLVKKEEESIVTSPFAS